MIGVTGMCAKRLDPDAIDIDFLKQEFNRFRTELGGMKDRLSDNAASALDQFSAYLEGGALSSRLASLEKEFDYLADKVKGTGKEAVGKLENQVTQRPIASIAIAFGIGVLASQFFRRS